MKALFFNMLNASFYGSVVILAVLLLRLVLKKAPRAVICLLWLLVGIRLVLPFSIESSLSLQPAAEDIAQIRQEVVADDPNKELLPTVSPDQTQDIHIPAIPQQPAELPEDVQIVVSDDAVSEVVVTEKPERVVDHGAVAAWVWAAGIAGLLAYSTWSYWRLRRQVREAVRQADGSWECPGLDTAFVLGLFRPRIYLPGGLSDRDRELILAHEGSHIARKDHWIKPIGYLILMLHWFNPLVWLAYVCLCWDIEMACDERVVKTMDVAARKDYSLALLNCSSRGIGIAACPVAFGEVGVKQRILGVLHYRKPGFWIVTAAVVAVVFVAVCLMTDPADKSESPMDNETVNEQSEELPPLDDETVIDQWDELPPLELCRRALEEFKSRKSGYVTWENTFGSNGVIQSRVTGEYWFAGENWLRRTDPNSASSVYRPSYLGIGDWVYRGSGDEVEEWFAVGDEGAAGLQPWIFSLEWDEEKISLISDEWVEDERQIILEVQEAPPSVVDGSVTQYQVSFWFDREGRFTGTTHAYLEPGGEVDTIVVSVMNIPKTTNQDPEQVLAEAMEPLLRQQEREVARCRDTLAAIRELDAYHIVQQDYYGGSILNSVTVTNYWRSGEDWMYVVQNRDVDNGHIVYRLKKDGVEYQQELYDTLTDNPQGWPWAVVDVPSDCMDGNWLEVFSWKDSMVEHVITDAAGDDGTVVKMTVKEDPSAFGKYCPYEVRFWFESDGSLQSVELILEENEGKENWYIINSIYNIDHIENADAHVDAVYEDVCVALNCTDPNCTDVTHGHYGIACTVEHCDDPAHGHGGHDHH